MDPEYVIRNFNYGILLDYIRIFAVSFECNYIVVWDPGNFDDDVEGKESLIIFNAKAQKNSILIAVFKAQII